MASTKLTSPALAAEHHAADLARFEAPGVRAAERRVEAVHDIKRMPYIVRLGQRIDDVEVYGGELKVLMRRDFSLVAIAGDVANAPSKARGFSGESSAALQTAFHEVLGQTLAAPGKPGQKGDYELFELGSLLTSSSDFEPSAPARVKRVWFREDGQLLPAYYIEVTGRRPSDRSLIGEALVVADPDQRVLARTNLVHSDSFDYRVYATNGGDFRPFDAPTTDFTPHPTGTPDGSAPTPVDPVLVRVEGLNRNPNGVADPWLPPGALVTTGNNVDAFTDSNGPEGFSAGDFRASITSPGTFDYVYDQALGPLANQNQGKAAVTQLFYMLNWLHDWYYDSGFDEAGGNAQQSNFGRGGLEGDPLLAEAQQLTVRNNAMMMATADGASPVLHVYLWNGHIDSRLVTSLGTHVTGTAGFGPLNFDVSADLVLANDGAGTTTDACQPLVNAVAGKIVLVDRGSCVFERKTVSAQNAGAVGVIVINSVSSDLPQMDDDPSVNGTIPTLSILQDTGTALKAALQNGPVPGQMLRTTEERDASLDFSVIAHEFGHLLHLRHVSSCQNPQCWAVSEGLGDTLGFHAVMEDGDNPNDAYPLAGYVCDGLADHYYGLRRAPYSTDPNKNALSFRHISNGAALPPPPFKPNKNPNSEAHNGGEIWASMMFEGYAALLGAHPFEDARRRLSDYVVAGVTMAPDNTTFLEQRDAIVAVALATDVNDGRLLAEAFARRGAGTCAIGPERYSTTLQGVVEAFAVTPNVGGLAFSVDDDPGCDDDGILDAGESGKIVIEINNVGIAPLTTATVTLSSTTPGITFPHNDVPVPSIAALSSGVVEVPVVLDPTFVGPSLALQVALTSAEACTSSTLVELPLIANIDQRAASSATDTVESADTEWTLMGEGASATWSRIADAGADHVWRAIDQSFRTDAALVSPPLQVSASAPFSISFSHRFHFESAAAQNYDGAVIELSVDDGPWTDVSTYGTPGYNGTIVTSTNTLLAGRAAYTGQNAAWPGEDTVRIELGTALAGRSVRVRFRFGSDDATGDIGWFLDDMGFGGIDNLPFATVSPDVTVCPPEPTSGGGGSGGGRGGAPGQSAGGHPSGAGKSAGGHPSGAGKSAGGHPGAAGKSAGGHGGGAASKGGRGSSG